MKMPEEDFDELEELEVKPGTPKNVVPISIKDTGISSSKSDLSDIDELDEEEAPLPGEKTRAGHVMGSDGKEKKSDGREVVDGVENAAKIIAIAGSGGAAGGAAAAGEGRRRPRGGHRRLRPGWPRGRTRAGTPWLQARGAGEGSRARRSAAARRASAQEVAPQVAARVVRGTA